MPQRNRKSEQIRRANRVIQSRSFILMLVMGVLLFVVLFFKLYQLQIGRHDELQKKAINQQVRSTVVTASRGTIYDREGRVLAMSATTYTVYVSPAESFSTRMPSTRRSATLKSPSPGRAS